MENENGHGGSRASPRQESELFSPGKGSTSMNSTTEEDWHLELHRAAIHSDWKSAEKIIMKYEKAISAKITGDGEETVLHVSVTRNNSIADRLIEHVEKFVQEKFKDFLEQKNKDGKTALATAAVAGNVVAAVILVNKHERLLYIKNKKGLMPLHYAAKYGHRKMVEYLIKITKEKEELKKQNGFHALPEISRFRSVEKQIPVVEPSQANKDKENEEEQNPFEGTSGVTLLNFLISADFHDLALKLLEENSSLSVHKDYHGTTALQTLAQRPLAFERRSFFSRFPSCYGCSRRIRDGLIHHHLRHGQTLDLLKGLCQSAMVSSSEENVRLGELLEEPLLIAARFGIHDFVIEILKIHPGLIWTKDKKTKQSIFHIAVIYRHEKLFASIYKMVSDKHPAVQGRDNDDNNILHLAGMLSPPGRISGAALHMQRELQWFKEVEKCVQPSYIEKYNKSGETPRMVFRKQHKQLLAEAKKWMHKTATACSLVAALILTVMFTVAFKIPGIDNEKDKAMSSRAFAIAGGIGLVFSSASVLLFLSILISRYTENDILWYLPLKLILGLFGLFVAIAAMTVIAFGSNYAFYTPRGPGIAAVQASPAVLFLLLLFPLFQDIIASTWRLRIVDK